MSTSRTCYAIGCSNSDYQLLRWRGEICSLHGVLHASESCTCAEPFWYILVYLMDIFRADTISLPNGCHCNIKNKLVHRLII